MSIPNLELESWNFERMFNVHYVSYVMCHVSHVRCHMSPVPCHMSPVTRQIFFLIKEKNILNKIGQRGGVSRWRVCYQRGLPRLVFRRIQISKCIQITLLVQKLQRFCWMGEFCLLVTLHDTMQKKMSLFFFYFQGKPLMEKCIF